MKAVVYHADGPNLWSAPRGAYKRLFAGFVENCHAFGIQVVHLTVTGHEGWGDETIRYDLDARTPMMSRERAFCEFLEGREGVFWFTEPDARILKPIPGLKTDLAVCYRDDEVPMTPSFRLATSAALPVFEEIRDAAQEYKNHAWHCDSWGATQVYKRMGSPKLGVTEYRGIRIEFRPYADYISGPYVKHYKFVKKRDLLGHH